MTVNDPKSVLVTGASGFLGRHVVTTLLDNGYNVVAHYNRKDLLPEVKERCERVLAGNICDPDVQQKALQGVRYVCHLAAHIPEQHAGIQEAEQCFSVNAQATLELATMASEKGVSRFIHFSAGNMYVRSDEPASETSRIFPSEFATDYLVSKLAAEIYLTNIDRRVSMDIIILRIGTPYGSGEPGNKVIPTFLRLAEQGRQLNIVNGGLATFNFVLASDVADIVVRAIEGGDPGIYNVASGEHTSLLELAHAVSGLYAEREVTLNIESPTKDAFLGFPAISIEKTRKTFRISPCSLSDGLAEYRESLVKNEDHP